MYTDIFLFSISQISQKGSDGCSFDIIRGISSNLEMIFKVDRKYASMQKVAVIQEWDNVGGVWVYGFVLKRSVATQEVCGTGGQCEIIQEWWVCRRGVLVHVGKDIEEVWGYRGGSTEEVIQKICVSTGGVCLYRGSAVIEEVRCLLQRTCVHVREVCGIYTGSMQLFRVFLLVQRVCTCTGWVTLYSRCAGCRQMLPCILGGTGTRTVSGIWESISRVPRQDCA